MDEYSLGRESGLAAAGYERRASRGPQREEMGCNKREEPRRKLDTFSPVGRRREADENDDGENSKQSPPPFLPPASLPRDPVACSKSLPIRAGSRYTPA